MEIIRIDLSSDEINREKILRDSKYFLMGGRGLTSNLINDEIHPSCDPLSEENKLIFANGLLAGTPFPNSARTSIGSKSPLTNGIKEANVGGRPAMMLAIHGIRALVLEKKASSLKFILINDNNIKLENAENYEYLRNYELHSKLRERYGKNIGIYSIGPAGEFLMKASSIAANDLDGNPSRHAARGGLGAVMGSKKVKAIIIFPTKYSKVKIHNLKKFREISKPFALKLAQTRKTFSIYGTPNLVRVVNLLGGLPTKNFRMGTYDKHYNISGEQLHELISKRNGKKRIACSPTCVIRCSNIFLDKNRNYLTSSLEYETIALNGSNLMIDNLDDIAKIDRLCDDIGLDTIEFGVSIGVAMDNSKISWGDSKKVFEILEEIGSGTELGNLYGNGVCHLGKEISAKRIPHIKGQGISGYDPRVFKAMGATYVTTPMGADHTAGAALAGRKGNRNKEYGELTENDGKLDLSFELQIYTTIMDLMGCCYFIGPNYENMELLADTINAMYELTLTREDLINLGINIIKTELAFNKKAGISLEMDDVPQFFREEPLEGMNLKFTFDQAELKSFWNRLDKYDF